MNKQRLPTFFYLSGLIGSALVCAGLLCYALYFGDLSLYFDGLHIENYLILSFAFFLLGCAFVFTIYLDAKDGFKDDYVTSGTLNAETLANNINRLRKRLDLPPDTFLRQSAMATFAFMMLSFCLPPLSILALAALCFHILRIGANINALISPSIPIGARPPVIRWSLLLCVAVLGAYMISSCGTEWIQIVVVGARGQFWWLLVPAAAATFLPWLFWYVQKSLAEPKQIVGIWVAGAALGIGTQFMIPGRMLPWVADGSQFDVGLVALLLRTLIAALSLTLSIRSSFWLTFGALFCSGSIFLTIGGPAITDAILVPITQHETLDVICIFAFLESIFFMIPLYHATRIARCRSHGWT